VVEGLEPGLEILAEGFEGDAGAVGRVGGQAAEGAGEEGLDT
jgi:hypothetical protein